MELSGYVFTICILLSLFCVLTPHFIFSIFIHFRKWYKIMENVICPLIVVLFFVAWGLVIWFLEIFGAPISKIPFGMQIAVICVVGLINTIEFCILGILFENYPFINERVIGGGIGNTDFGEE